MFMDEDQFKDVKALIFDGFIKETVKFKSIVIVIRTLSLADENSIINTYENLSDSYNLLVATDTLKFSLYSINGCRITNEICNLIYDWPKQLIIKLFNTYLSLTDRARIATKQIEDFVTTNESKLRWSIIKSTKINLNSAIITGNPEFESKGLSFSQQLWIYLNQQEDLLLENKLNWSRIEYMTESICAFINPKAMRQIQNKKKLDEEEQFVKEQREELKKIQNESSDKTMIENTADELFDSLERKKGESALDYRERINQAVSKAWEEDEHDRIVREYEEYEFSRQLRIQKENTRRRKILNEQRKQNSFVIDLPENNPKIPTAFHQVSTFGNDDDQFELMVEQEKTNNAYFINNVDYSEIVEITSFCMLKNRDKILNEIANESDEETSEWIEKYIKTEGEQQFEIDKELNDIQKDVFSTSESQTDALLNRRGQILSKGKNKFENQQNEMIKQIQSDNDEIGFGG